MNVRKKAAFGKGAVGSAPKGAVTSMLENRKNEAMPIKGSIGVQPYCAGFKPIKGSCCAK